MGAYGGRAGGMNNEIIPVAVLIFICGYEIGRFVGRRMPAKKQLASQPELPSAEMIAAALAHRACCGTEHDPNNGKLHGYCVVCGVPFPCDTAKRFMDAQQPSVQP